MASSLATSSHFRPWKIVFLAKRSFNVFEKFGRGSGRKFSSSFLDPYRGADVPVPTITPRNKDRDLATGVSKPALEPT